MRNFPELSTNRLLLRPFDLNDAGAVQMLAGEKEVAATTLNIPHPYEDGLAEAWIRTHSQLFASNKALVFAIVDKQKNHLIGCIALHINQAFERGEIVYWIGKPYWNQGYCTEAVHGVLRYAFTTLQLCRICAECMQGNIASGRVLKKAGFQEEGQLRKHIKKWGRFYDLFLYGILREEFRVEP